jgi:CRP-like cAMP-binding protein
VPAVRVGGPPPTFLARHPALVATSYDGKEEIYGESDPAEYVYQVIRGAVRTYKLLNDGRRQIGAFHLPGDVFGLESGVEHRLTAEAIIETTVRVVKRRALEAVAKTDVRIACEFWTLRQAISATRRIICCCSAQDCRRAGRHLPARNGSPAVCRGHARPPHVPA